jgi:hypothetical protein
MYTTLLLKLLKNKTRKDGFAVKTTQEESICVLCERCSDSVWFVNPDADTESESRNRKSIKGKIVIYH